MLKLRTALKALANGAGTSVAIARRKMFPIRNRSAGMRDRLQIGCGENHFAGWYNADITWNAEVVAFMGKRLPFPSDSLRFIHSEHVIEHVSRDIGVKFLKEAHRVLRRGGVCRIGTPSLTELVEAYLAKDWQRFEWVDDYKFIDTPAKMLNTAFYFWGHQFLYDEDELLSVCREGGFGKSYAVNRLESSFPELRGLETRSNTNLVVEAVKQ